MTTQERRRYPRAWWPFSIKYQIPIRYQVPAEAGDMWHSGVAVNLSVGGLRFTCQELLSPDTEVIFELVIDPKQDPFLVEGEIVWGDTIEQGAYEHGAAFMDLTPDQHRQIKELVEFLNRKPLQLPQSGEER